MSGLRLGKLIAKAKKGPVPLASTRHIHTRLLSGLHWIEYLGILLSPKGRETQRRLLIYSQDEQASSRHTKTGHVTVEQPCTIRMQQEGWQGRQHKHNEASEGIAVRLTGVCRRQLSHAIRSLFGASARRWSTRG